MAIHKTPRRVVEGVVGFGKYARPQFQVVYNSLEVEEGESFDEKQILEEGDEWLVGSYPTREEAEHAASL